LPCILVIDDEKNTRDTLVQLFDSEYEAFGASSHTEATNLLKNERFDVVLTDLRMQGRDGMFILDEVNKLPRKPVCIMMSAYGNIETAVEALKHGAFDFVTKPIDFDRLNVLIKRAINSRGPAKESKLAVKNKSDGAIPFVGSSECLGSILNLIKKIAPTKANILFEGETGTGKELFANAVHNYSNRKNEPFVAIHCAALPKNLLESELFGHEKGAFTGADSKYVGLFERANGGSVFLDEVGEIDLDTQVKLLRFLETRKFYRIGGTGEISVDSRIICATNRNLAKLVADGKFREDLFYRLNVIGIRVPSLRERKDDIPALLLFYIKKFCDDNDLVPPKLSPEVMDVLVAYKWPGNIRELRNFCESVVILYNGEDIKLDDIDRKFSLG
ncbi:MAG: sigma-54 dependent transcriptional regulator, partial [Puniceicoccales bacterium]|jgi:DNA-binding NtrC family response regulator|nr:sigma-54 dependent transcriptional regulator [Puniceicoccales bacterium]